MKILRSYTSVCLLASSLAFGTMAMTACSKADGSKPSSQVAVKVGEEEISMHQINAVLAMDNTRNVTPEQLQVRSRAVLEGLIDQQLALNQAIETNVNRDPDVIAQIEASRRQVLATAYVRQFASSVPKPDEQEVRAYLVGHPSLFAERRIFNIQEVVTPNSPDLLSQLNSMAEANATVEEVTVWLKAHKVDFTRSTASRSSEQVPMDLLPKMHALTDGHDAVFPAPKGITFLRLVSSQKAPLAEPVALASISQYLNNQRIGAAIADHMKVLRSKATVVYEGEFAQPIPKPAAVQTGVRATETATTVAPDVGPVKSSLEKGVAGLK